jgi:hypothetical protein
MVADGHVVCVERGDEEDWHVKVHEGVELESTESHSVFQGRLGRCLSEHLCRMGLNKEINIARDIT